jgi:hypothetical protein
MSLVDRELTPEEREVLNGIANDAGAGELTQRRAQAVVVFLRTSDLKKAAKASRFSIPTVRKILKVYNDKGWQSLLSVPSPRGGDFLARYDNGFWAERLTRVFFDRSNLCRAIPYGTSRSEPFTDLQTFREYVVNEALLQAWSAGQRWKRPDLLLIPRSLLQRAGGTDVWTPDLLHWDNARCQDFLNAACAGVEVETSLWQVKRATVPLSFTVKDEDLDPLRNWVRVSNRTLYIVQVFYDQAFVLPFSKLEFLISGEAPKERRVRPELDRFTKKSTYRVSLTEGLLLGDIGEPDVEGKIYKAPNGRITVYGRLTGSHIEPTDMELLEALSTGKSSAAI